MGRNLEKKNGTCTMDITTHIYPHIRKRLTKCINDLDITLFEDEWEALETYFQNNKKMEEV